MGSAVGWDEHISVLVRPYALTGGRTRPDVDIAIETLLITTPYGQTRTDQWGGSEERVLSLCRHRPLSLAEIAALSHLPLGVARIFVSDLVTAGLVTVAGQTLGKDGSHTPDLLGRLLQGLRKL